MAAAKFSHYSEHERSAIAAEVRRLKNSSSVDMIGLIDKLERLGRYYASDPSVDPDQLKLLAAKEKQVAEFRRQVVEGGQLPPEVKQRLAEAVDEAERSYQDRIKELDRDYGLQTETIEARRGF